MMGSSRLTKFLTHNRGLKLVSLLIALVLWMRVAGSEGAEGQYKAAFVLTNVPKSLVLVGDMPENLSVRISGPRAVVSALDERSLNFSLDLSGMQEGINSFELTPSGLNLPRGAEVIQMSPSKIKLQADRKIRKTIPVNPRLVGVPAKGFAVDSVDCEPSQVEVEGAERNIRETKSVFTELIDVSGITEDAERSAEVAIYGTGLRLPDKKSVRVALKVREIEVQRAIPGVAVITPSVKWAAKPFTVEVRLSGNAADVAGVEMKDIEVRAVPGGKGSQKGTAPLTVKVPEGITVTGVEPAEVRLVPSGR